MMEIDVKSVEDEVLDSINEKLEEARSLAEHYAERIMPKKGEKLCEVKMVDGKVFIVMTAHGAHIDEFGSVYQPPNAPLRRALEATGMRLEPSPKP